MKTFVIVNFILYILSCIVIPSVSYPKTLQKPNAVRWVLCATMAIWAGILLIR